MVDTLGKPQVSGEEACGSPGAAHVLRGLVQRHPAAQAPHGNGSACFIHLSLKAQFLYTFQKMPGIVRKQYALQTGGAVSQRGQQQGPVGNALGARDIRGNRGGDGSGFLLQDII